MRTQPGKKKHTWFKEFSGPLASREPNLILQFLFYSERLALLRSSSRLPLLYAIIFSLFERFRFHQLGYYNKGYWKSTYTKLIKEISSGLLQSSIILLLSWNFLKEVKNSIPGQVAQLDRPVLLSQDFGLIPDLGTYRSQPMNPRMSATTNRCFSLSKINKNC